MIQSRLKSIVVFCGSSAGKNPVYALQARELGKLLVAKNITLIYGGSRLGIMGAVANTMMDLGGEVIGVIPKFLKTKEVAAEGISKLIEVENMHERKLLMHDLSDAVMTLPGGFGTMEEYFEMITWAQLGLHQKPVGILNTNGYYDLLLRQLELMVEEGFLRQENREMVLIDEYPQPLLEKMEQYTPPPVEKWLDKGQT